MPWLALIAGLGLVVLEWREGFGFWMIAALILVLFAVAALLFPGEPRREAGEREDEAG
jgi:hypothetical protein